jgi:phosphate transport system permease protein
MTISLLIGVLLLLSVIGYYMGRARSVRTVSGRTEQLHSLPSYSGYYVAVWCGLPALLIIVAWLALSPDIIRALLVDSLGDQASGLSSQELGLMINDIRNSAGGGISSRELDPVLQQAAAYYNNLHSLSQWAMTVLVLAVAIAGLSFAYRRIAPQFRSRNRVERVVQIALVICSIVAVLTTIGIVLSLVFESARFFLRVSPLEFLFGMEWSPQIALRPGQVGGSGLFGAIPLFVGTLLISLIAMCVAMPVGLMSAIFMAEYAPPRVRSVAKPVLEVLAGIPTVVYGFFAALTVAPFFRDIGGGLGLTVSSESALAAGVVMGIMIIPFVSSLSDDVITAVPRAMREGSYGLGATQSETIRRVLLPAALPGIVGGFLLAVSRAIGETMIVVMAAGLAANMSLNPLDAVTTVTVQIATLLVGDQEFDSPKTLAAFALGLVLFCVTLVLNIIALRVVRKYREQYE